MPFKSDKQRKYLWSQKPDVARQIAYKNEGGYTEDGIATHYRNGKPKPPEQIAYERRVKKSNQQVIDDGIIETIADFTPIGTMKAIDKGYTTGDWTDAAIEGAMGLAGPLAGGAGKLGKRAWGVKDEIGALIKHGYDPDYVDLVKRGLKNAPEPKPKSVGASALYGADANDVDRFKQVAEITGDNANDLRDSVSHARRNIDKLKKNARTSSGAQDKIDDYRAAFGDDWEDILVDMEVEAARPHLAVNRQYGPLSRIKESAEGFGDRVLPNGMTKRGTIGKVRDYRNYRTLGGDNIHAIYGKPNTQGVNPASPINILGGSGEDLIRSSQGHAGTDLFPLGNSIRPGGHFDLIGSKGRPGKVLGGPDAHLTVADRVTPEMTSATRIINDAPLGPRLPEFNPNSPHVQKQVLKAQQRGKPKRYGGPNRGKPNRGKPQRRKGPLTASEKAQQKSQQATRQQSNLHDSIKLNDNSRPFAISDLQSGKSVADVATEYGVSKGEIKRLKKELGL